MSKQEILEILFSDNGNDIISEAYIEELMNKRKRNEILKKHCYKIYKCNDGRWATYLPDPLKGRVLKKKKKKEELEDIIVDYYNSCCFHTMYDIFKDWVEQKLKYGEIQHQTYEKYCNDYERYIKGSALDKKDFGKITEDDLENFIRETIRTQGTHKDFNGNKPITSKAYNNIKTVIIGTFKHAKKLGYTKISITNFFGDLSISNRIFAKRTRIDNDNIFFDNEVDMIVQYVHEHPTIRNLGVLLAFQTGLRVGELASLKWEDIKENKLIVRRTEIRVKKPEGGYDYLIQDFPKTEAGVRFVYFTSSTKDTIRMIKNLNPDGEFLLMEKDGTRIKTIYYDRTIRRICRKLKIPERSMHVARKTYATSLINAKIDEKIIVQQLGHTNISVTKMFYYYNNKREDEVCNQLESAARW